MRQNEAESQSIKGQSCWKLYDCTTEHIDLKYFIHLTGSNDYNFAHDTINESDCYIRNVKNVFIYQIRSYFSKFWSDDKSYQWV